MRYALIRYTEVKSNPTAHSNIDSQVCVHSCGYEKCPTFMADPQPVARPHSLHSIPESCYLRARLNLRALLYIKPRVSDQDAISTGPRDRVAQYQIIIAGHDVIPLYQIYEACSTTCDC